LSLGALAATTGTASAGHERYERRGHIGFSIDFGGPRFYDHGYYGFRHHRRIKRRRFCRPRKAVRKARRRGVRGAHVIRVGRRGVLVARRKWGDRVVIGFGNRRHCPVRFIDHR